MKYLHITRSTTPSSDYFGGHVWLNKEVNKVVYTIGNKIATIKDIIKEGRKIISFIDTYKETHTSISDSSDLILAQYGRIGRYNDSTWAVAGGNIDASLKAELDAKFLYFQNIQEIDLPNGDKLDAPHFWAVINTLFKGYGDLGGWAGDLVQFAATLKTNPSETFPTSSSGGFDKVDWNSDADAYNIIKTYSNDLLSDMQAYFIEDLSEKQRIDEFITENDIETRFNNSNNKLFLNFLMTKYGVTSITDAATKMQTYLDANK